MALAVSQPSGVAIVPTGMPSRRSRCVSSASSSCMSAGVSTLGSVMLGSSGQSTPSRSSSVSPVAKPLTLTLTPWPFFASALMPAFTIGRAAAFSWSGTESSRSRISVSAP